METTLAIALFLASAIRMSVPLLLGTLGESLTERSGSVNLGVEGLMMMGAASGFMAAYRTGSIVLAVLFGMLGSGFGALIYAVLTITFRTKQDVTGPALTIFGSGFANTLCKKLANQNTPAPIRAFAGGQPLHLDLGGLAGIPVLGPVLRFLDTALLQHNAFVYAAFILAVGGWFFLFRTRQGLHVRMIGENPAAAEASGIRVIALKYASVIAGGMLCGLGGVYISVINVGSYLENIVAGRGWIVVALVIFIRWDPLKAIAGSLLFGALEIVGFRLQNVEGLANIPFFSQYVIDMYPYLMTIIVLILTYARKKAYLGPAALGVPYFREDR